MAADQEVKGAIKKQRVFPSGTQPKIVWDDKNMRSLYSNVANVVGGREELMLLFGLNQAWHAGHEEIKVQLTDRILMSPFAAKRLSLLLNKVLADYEARYGTLAVGIQRPEGVTVQ